MSKFVEVKIIQTREAWIQLVPSLYPEKERTIEKMIAIEKFNSETMDDYMELLDCTNEFTFEIMENNDEPGND